MPSVLLVCGDHGMRDTGGHGGSSVGEVMVPLLVYYKNKKCGGIIEYVQITLKFNVLLYKLYINLKLEVKSCKQTLCHQFQ